MKLKQKMTKMGNNVIAAHLVTFPKVNIKEQKEKECIGHSESYYPNLDDD